MPRAPKKRVVPEAHSSEVDELAEDAPTGLTPPRARSSSCRTSTTHRGAAPGIKAASMPAASTSKAKRSRPSAVAASAAPSTTSSSTRLDSYRCQAKPVAHTSTLYETNSVSPVKRTRPAKAPPHEAPTSSPSSSTKRRRRTADTDENDRAAVQRKVKREDEFVFVMPDLDEDGEPIVNTDSDAPAVRSSPPPPPAASSPFRPPILSPSPTKPQRSPFRAAPTRPHPPRTPSPPHLPPSSSSIDLPDAIAARVYGGSSPAQQQQQQSEPHTSTTLVAGDDGPSPHARERSSSPPFVPRGRGRTALAQPGTATVQGASTGTSACATPRLTAHGACSQRELTSEEKREVSALLAELEVVHMVDGELQEGAFETYVETCVEPMQGKGAPRPRKTVEAGGAREEVADPDKTLVDISPGGLDCAGAASPRSPSPVAAAVNPFTDDMPLPVPAPARTPAFRSPTPPARAPLPSPPRARAAPPPPAAPSPPLNRSYHPATPPRRPPGYCLVPLTLDGLATHARAVVAAAATTSAPSTETTYLRGEVRRLAAELEARDRLLGEREVLVRGAQGEQERFARERGEWADERTALVRKVDALREVRRGLLRELREEQERADGLEDRVRALEGASEAAAQGASDVEHDEPVAGADASPAAQPAPDELEAVDAVEPVEET
ncbi:hypothetical protein JCM9279_002320 [Rhodotorula babjevae]